MNEVTVCFLEHGVYDLEGIRICVRLPTSARVKAFHHAVKASDDMLVADWLRTRIVPLLPRDSEVVVVAPKVGFNVHGLLTLGHVRQSYVN